MKLTDFLPGVDVAGAPQPLAVRAVFNAIEELCQRSTIWRVTLDYEPILKGFAEYTLQPPQDTEVVQVINLWAGTRKLWGKGEDQLDHEHPSWRSACGAPSCFSPTGPDTFLLVPRPTKTQALGLTHIRVALQPTVTATEVPSLFSRYRRCIESGAKAYLYGLDKKPWTDAVAADRENRRFRQLISRAGADAARGFTRSSQMGGYKLPGTP